MADNLTVAQRSYCMSQVRHKDTKLELQVRSELHRRGLRFRKHVKGLPGKPDIVFGPAKVVVFLDGDFWHGYDFDKWQHKLPRQWKEKISTNIHRDQDNHRLLTKMGWEVIRIWQHEVNENFCHCIEHIIATVQTSRGGGPVNALNTSCARS